MGPYRRRVIRSLGGGRIPVFRRRNLQCRGCRRYNPAAHRRISRQYNNRDRCTSIRLYIQFHRPDFQRHIARRRYSSFFGTNTTRLSNPRPLRMCFLVQQNHPSQGSRLLPDWRHLVKKQSHPPGCRLRNPSARHYRLYRSHKRWSARGLDSTSRRLSGYSEALKAELLSSFFN